MIVTVFRTRLNAGVDDEYGPTAGRMSELARGVPGYISHKGFVADDGERVTIVEFESEEALQQMAHRSRTSRGQEAGVSTASIANSNTRSAASSGSGHGRPRRRRVRLIDRTLEWPSRRSRDAFGNPATSFDVMHLSKRRRRQSEFAFERKTEPGCRSHAASGCDYLEGEVRRKQRARALQPCILDKSSRRLTRGSDESSIERSFRQPAPACERRGHDRLGDVAFKPGDEFREWRACLDLGIQHFAELGLITGPARVQHHELRDLVGGGPADILFDHRQRHVDPGGHARRRPGFSAHDKQRVPCRRTGRETVSPARRNWPNALRHAGRPVGRAPQEYRCRSRSNRSGRRFGCSV